MSLANEVTDKALLLELVAQKREVQGQVVGADVGLLPRDVHWEAPGEHTTPRWGAVFVNVISLQHDRLLGECEQVGHGRGGVVHARVVPALRRQAVKIG